MGERVYIIDGGGRSGVALCFTLATAGYDALFYPRLSLFLAQADDVPPGCIFVDVDCPAEGRVDALQSIRARGIGWPVVAVSTDDDPGLAARALGAGADDYVVAPADPSDVLATLRAVRAGLAERLPS